MIKSMTGYGRGQQIIDGREITVEIKSVNRPDGIKRSFDNDHSIV